MTFAKLGDQAMSKKYFRDPSSFQALAIGLDACIASDRITVDGAPVGYMYREQPENSVDSGWRFFSGDESDDFANDPNNLSFYDINTIANYDPSITEHLQSEIGASFIRRQDSFERET